jgi:hypothetical protein
VVDTDRVKVHRQVSHRGTLSAWKIRYRSTLAAPGSRGACGSNRSGPPNAADLWLVHNDDEVSSCYDNDKPSLEVSTTLGEVHGPLPGASTASTSGSRTTARAAWSSVAAGCRARRSTTTGVRSTPSCQRSRGPRPARESAAHPWRTRTGSRADGRSRREFWGHGYASEIGRAGWRLRSDVLGAQAVVSCTVRHNVRSRAVMERIGMRVRGRNP